MSESYSLYPNSIGPSGCVALSKLAMNFEEQKDLVRHLQTQKHCHETDTNTTQPTNKIPNKTISNVFVT